MTQKPGNEKTYPAGTLLFKEGDKGGDTYIITKGEVEVFRLRNEREWQLAVGGAGEILGAMTATTQGPRTASARACRMFASFDSP